MPTATTFQCLTQRSDTKIIHKWQIHKITALLWMFWPLRFHDNDVDTQKWPAYTKLKRLLKHIYIGSYPRKNEKWLECLKVFPSVKFHKNTLCHQLELLQKYICQHNEWQNQNSGNRSLSGNHTKAHGILYTALGLPNQIRQRIFAFGFNSTIHLINNNFSVNTVPPLCLVIWRR